MRLQPDKVVAQDCAHLDSDVAMPQEAETHLHRLRGGRMREAGRLCVHMVEPEAVQNTPCSQL